MNYREALRKGEEYLESHQVADAALDAWYLLEFSTKMDRARYFLNQQEELPDREWEAYERLLKKRGEHIPLQHLTGVQQFMGLDFEVNDQVLIPRQDTEILVEETLKRLRPKDRVLDMCTGSGCIIISLKKMKEEIKAVAADISEEALKVAARNAKKLQVQVTFCESDLFSRIEGTFDCIVSNPPYIPQKEMEELMPEVRDYEPRKALDGKETGLYFYERITEEIAGYLNPGGWLLFEIGYDQGEAVSRLMELAGFEEIEIVNDLAGLNRVVLGRRR